MTITAAQCRAARGLLAWSQEELATNALVSRATVADFEANARRPMRNNLASMRDCMFAAGVEFTDEKEGGVGVKFREQKIEYIKNVRIDGGDASLQMRYAGEPFVCIISREAIADFHHTSGLQSDEAISLAVSKMLHHILAIAENRAKTGIQDGRMIITSDALSAATG